MGERPLKIPPEVEELRLVCEKCGHTLGAVCAECGREFGCGSLAAPCGAGACVELVLPDPVYVAEPTIEVPRTRDG